MTTTEVSHNSDHHRFELRVDGVLAGFLDYSLTGTIYSLNHTQISPEFGGRGLGSKLVIGALEDIRNRDGQVLPYCSFIPKVLADNPAFIQLIPNDQKATFGLV